MIHNEVVMKFAIVTPEEVDGVVVGESVVSHSERTNMFQFLETF